MYDYFEWLDTENIYDYYYWDIDDEIEYFWETSTDAEKRKYLGID